MQYSLECSVHDMKLIMCTTEYVLQTNFLYLSDFNCPILSQTAITTLNLALSPH
jgi:hypothetical protein